MRRLILAIVALLSISNVAAQYQEEGWDYFYDYEHRIVRRSMVECTENYQNLWNGDYVRTIGSNIHIYRNGSSILYGKRIWLFHNGCYAALRGSTVYFYGPDGGPSRFYGNEINMLWNGACSVLRGSTYYLFDSDGSRIGGLYSKAPITIFWNGCYEYKTGSNYYIALSDGTQMPNSYSTEPHTITAQGHFCCKRGSRWYTIDTTGNTLH